MVDIKGKCCMCGLGMSRGRLIATDTTKFKGGKLVCPSCDQQNKAFDKTTERYHDALKELGEFEE